MTKILGLTPAEHAVRIFFKKQPKDKPLSISTIAKGSGVDWHTAKETAEKLVGKVVNGKLQKTTDDSRELFFRDPQVSEPRWDRNKSWAEIIILIVAVLTPLIIYLISRARRRPSWSEGLRGLSDELMQKFGLPETLADELDGIREEWRDSFA